MFSLTVKYKETKAVMWAQARIHEPLLELTSNDVDPAFKLKQLILSEIILNVV